MRLTAKVFKNGQSQAIRIPKEFRVNSDEVYIEKAGNTIIIKPKFKDKWESFFQELSKVDTHDFLKQREQLPIQERELF